MRLSSVASIFASAIACLVAFTPRDAHAAICAFESVVGTSFGTYDVFDPAALTSTGGLRILCTVVGASDVITVELSRGSSSTFLPRTMTRPGASLSYNLYLDAALTTVWGDGTSGTSRYGPVTPPDGSAFTITIYGQLPARQNVSVGAYSDTITATLVY